MLTTATTFASNNVKRILIALALVIASLGSYAAVSPKADAATGVSFCFVHQNGYPYANMPVRLMARDGSVIRNGSTTSTGCATFFNTPSNRSLFVQVRADYGNHNIGLASYRGSTPYYVGAGIGTAHVGTGIVYKSCTQGLYGYCAGH